MVASHVKSQRSVLLFDLPWRSYKGMLTALGDHHFRHTFQESTLEIFPSPTERQEQIRSCLGWMVQTITLEANYWIMSTECATLTDQRVHHGLEPGNSFIVRSTRPREKWPPRSVRPDIAIDVDICTPQLDRIQSYERLGIGEVWRYRANEVEVLCLSESRILEPVSHSGVFPFLSNRDLMRFVNETKTDQLTAMRAFIAWLRKQIKKSPRPSRKKEK